MPAHSKDTWDGSHDFHADGQRGGSRRREEDPQAGGRERERTTMAQDEGEERRERGGGGQRRRRERERERDSQERRGRAGCYLSHHKAVITFSLPDRSLATLLVAPRSISG